MKKYTIKAIDPKGTDFWERKVQFSFYADNAGKAFERIIEFKERFGATDTEFVVEEVEEQ